MDRPRERTTYLGSARAVRVDPEEALAARSAGGPYAVAGFGDLDQTMQRTRTCTHPGNGPDGQENDEGAGSTGKGGPRSFGAT